MGWDLRSTNSWMVSSADTQALAWDHVQKLKAEVSNASFDVR